MNALIEQLTLGQILTIASLVGLALQIRRISLSINAALARNGVTWDEMCRRYDIPPDTDPDMVRVLISRQAETVHKVSAAAGGI